MKNTEKPQVEILRRAMLFSLTRHAWGNRRQADKTKFTVNANKNSVTFTKKLLPECPELDAIVTEQNRLYNWCLSRSMMANGVSGCGVYFVAREVTIGGKKVDHIEMFEAEIARSRSQIKDVLVPKLIKAYPERKRLAQQPPTTTNDKIVGGGLGDLYDERDYPSPEDLDASFDIEHTWFALSVPDELPADVRKRENAKLQAKLEATQSEMVFMLREMMLKLVAHAVERLEVKAGEKPKVFFADSMVANFKEFFDTFSAKNIMADTEIEALVEKAKSIVDGFSDNPTRLRDNTSLRNQVAAKFTEVKSTLDGLLKNRPTRRIEFED